MWEEEGEEIFPTKTIMGDRPPPLWAINSQDKIKQQSMHYQLIQMQRLCGELDGYCISISLVLYNPNCWRINFTVKGGSCTAFWKFFDGFEFFRAVDDINYEGRSYLILCNLICWGWVNHPIDKIKMVCFACFCIFDMVNWTSYQLDAWPPW